MQHPTGLMPVGGFAFCFLGVRHEQLITYGISLNLHTPSQNLCTPLAPLSEKQLFFNGNLVGFRSRLAIFLSLWSVHPRLNPYIVMKSPYFWGVEQKIAPQYRYVLYQYWGADM